MGTNPEEVFVGSGHVAFVDVEGRVDRDELLADGEEGGAMGVLEV